MALCNDEATAQRLNPLGIGEGFERMVELDFTDYSES